MVKKIKEKRPKKETPSLNEIKSAKLKKYSLILMLILTLSMIAFGTYLYMTTSYQHYKIVQKDQKASSDALMQKMKQMLDEEKARQATLPPPPSPVAETNVSTVVENNQSSEKPLENNETHVVQQTPEEESKAQERSEVHDYERSLKESGKPARPHDIVRKKYPEGTTPRLAIIIDDVSFPWQTRSIKEIPYKVTPSFFPPTKGHPETVRMSHEFPFAMIHLPMESKNYSSPEPETLNIVDSSEVIEKRIKRIKEWFPQIIYYNNHTGGSYTADYNAMDRLVKVLKENGLIFVDSRTVGNSKAPEITKKYGMFLYSRDVFLDNSLDKNLIRIQLKEAVTKAKKFGYAIAIGHPHKNTLEVLRDSKDLLNGVEMVYLKDL
ncbi:divergent polysaccharide deacetylase family protein [Sulfurospirillum halorespirans]|uniref:Divergent polysaccharide deacetylase family protein n=1 Tax=Sulfurospirillum halorespirans DSM 13726 TaxID=1193502 RepID=A0A1D7TIR3_9BACT|nr:divergent polysaccharide deacetylase family protein [Sulfurospirillum halorespirans]AOO64908.1 divergent polysaccharide deacetylase family protein [Sulfurospirillum halorespirans DSM 13726]